MANDLITVNTTAGIKKIPTITAFATTAFKCNGSGLLEPTVIKTGVLTGNGSSANPLGISGGTVGQVLTSNGPGQSTFQALPSETIFTGTEGNGIDLTAGGTAGHNPTIAVKTAANRTTGTCAGNVGANFAVRSAGLEFDGSGNLRTFLDSAPEHTFDTQGIAQCFTYSLSSPGVYVSPTLTLILNNPNPCRIMKCAVFTKSYVSMYGSNVGMGGTYPDLSMFYKGVLNANGLLQGADGTVQNFGATREQIEGETLPAGGTLSVTLSATFTTNGVTAILPPAGCISLVKIGGTI